LYALKIFKCENNIVAGKNWNMFLVKLKVCELREERGSKGRGGERREEERERGWSGKKRNLRGREGRKVKCCGVQKIP